MIMKQIKTASQFLAMIVRRFFKEAGLTKGSLLEGDERRAYRLSQVERLLTKKRGGLPLAMHLSDLFWTADEGRNPMYEDDLLMTLAGTLREGEMRRWRLIQEIAGLCHDLCLHFTFDLKEAFGFRKKDFWVSNGQLVKWLASTEYEQVAMHTAYILKKHAISVYERLHYLPAQDELAELYSVKYMQWVGKPGFTEMSPRDYVGIILDSLLAIERHWQRGRKLKLEPELVMLHDEICEGVPNRFDERVLKAAQALYDYMYTEVCGRLVLEEYDENASSWNDQPESVRLATAEVLNRFADKVREVRSQYLAGGWLTDDSLSFSYLMAHAQRCGHGFWREEDEAL